MRTTCFVVVLFCGNNLVSTNEVDCNHSTRILHGVRSGMASICLQPTSPFDFRTPEEWPRWKRRFEQFRHASGLTAEDDSRQISTLLYCMGDNAEDTLASTDISRADRSRYAVVIAKSDAFFQVWNNVIFERARFNQRNQEEGESAEQFITSLYSLADNCAYGDLKDDLIRDRIVVGIRATNCCQNACNWIRSWPWRKPRKSSDSMKLCRSSSKSSRMAPA